MRTPNIPQNETSRLVELLNLEILDTDPEPVYDNIIEMASMVCGTPMAFISFIDSDRQWNKAKKGLNANEVKRDVSFCAHVINENSIFVIPDALDDERFHDNPFVKGEPNIRFYAGAPIRSPSGHALGSLCVIDKRPRTLTNFQIDLLLLLSDQIQNLLILRNARIAQTRYLNELKASAEIVVEQKHKLQYLEKLEILRSMTSGLCHEINNPLSIIMLANSSLRRKLEGQTGMEDEIRRLEKAIAGAERISKVVTGLKHYALWDSSDRTALSMREVLEETLVLFYEKIKAEKIHLLIDKEDDSTIHVNRGEMIQVLTNLLQNSIDAISMLEDKWIKIELTKSPETGMLRVSVTDSGSGIKKEIQEKVMQPFFTTKETGKGSGLGLSICMGIIRDHGGKIFYDGRSGNTCFRIELPCA